MPLSFVVFELVLRAVATAAAVFVEVVKALDVVLGVLVVLVVLELGVDVVDDEGTWMGGRGLKSFLRLLLLLLLLYEW